MTWGWSGQVTAYRGIAASLDAREVMAPGRQPRPVLPGDSVRRAFGGAQIRRHGLLRQFDVAHPQGAERDACVPAEQIELRPPPLAVEKDPDAGEGATGGLLGGSVVELVSQVDLVATGVASPGRAIGSFARHPKEPVQAARR